MLIDKNKTTTTDENDSVFNDDKNPRSADSTGTDGHEAEDKTDTTVLENVDDSVEDAETTSIDAGSPKDGKSEDTDADDNEENDKDPRRSYSVDDDSLLNGVIDVKSPDDYSYMTLNKVLLDNEFKKAKNSIPQWESAIKDSPNESAALAFGFIDKYVDFNPRIQWIGVKPYMKEKNPPEQNIFQKLFSQRPEPVTVGTEDADKYGISAGIYDIEALNEGLRKDYRIRFLLENAIYSLQKAFFNDRRNDDGSYAIEDFSLVRVLAWYGRRLNDEIDLYIRLGATEEDLNDSKKNFHYDKSFIAPQWSEKELGFGALKPADYTIEDIVDLQGVDKSVVEDSVKTQMLARFDVWIYSYARNHYPDKVGRVLAGKVSAAMSFLEHGGFAVDKALHEIESTLEYDRMKFTPENLNTAGELAKTPEWNEMGFELGLLDRLRGRKLVNTRDLLDEIKAVDLGDMGEVDFEASRRAALGLSETEEVNDKTVSTWFDNYVNYVPGEIDESMPGDIRQAARELWFHGSAVKNTEPTPVNPEHKNWPVKGSQYYMDMQTVLDFEYLRRPIVNGVIGTDLETTGLKPTRVYIIDQGLQAMRLDDDSKPFDNIRLHYGVPSLREALGNPSEDICHISTEDVKGLLPFDEDFIMQSIVLEQLRRAPFVAHSAGFENGFFRLNVRGYAEAQRNGLIHIIDTKKLSRRLDPHNLNDLDSYSKRMGVIGDDVKERHLGFEDTDIMDRALRVHMDMLDLRRKTEDETRNADGELVYGRLEPMFGGEDSFKERFKRMKDEREAEADFINGCETSHTSSPTDSPRHQ